MALAAFVAPGAQPAQAQTTTVWSATLTVAQSSVGVTGCLQDVPCSSGLTDDTFTYDNVEYAVAGLYIEGGSINLTLNKPIPTDLKSALTLYVGSSPFPFADATLSGSGQFADAFATWTNTGLSNWSVGDTVQLSLTGGSSTTTTTTEDAPKPQVFPDLDRLPVEDSLNDPGTHAPYCYIGEGNGATEYIRYPNGRIEETTRQSDAIRSMFACD